MHVEGKFVEAEAALRLFSSPRSEARGPHGLIPAEAELRAITVFL